jgi:hypothetical protein
MLLIRRFPTSNVTDAIHSSIVPSAPRRNMTPPFHKCPLIDGSFATSIFLTAQNALPCRFYSEKNLASYSWLATYKNPNLQQNHTKSYINQKTH